MTSTRLGTAAWALVVIALLAGGATAATEGLAAAGKTRSFTDPIGDAGAPDLTTVAVAGDPASGTIRVSVTADGLFAIDRGLEPDVSVWLDTDRDVSTGSASGCEYGLKFWRSPSGVTWHMVRFDADQGRWQVSPPSPTTSFSRSGDVLTWRLSTADIGNATGFQFWLSSTIYALRHITAEDAAARDLRWTYDLSAAPAVFHDRADDAAAPDITKVAISSDAMSSATTLSVTARGMFAIARAQRPDLDVWLNTDRNDSTGSPTGSEYRLGFAVGPGGTAWRIYQWNARGRAWHAQARSPTMAFNRRGDVMTWRLGGADIGNAKAFEFTVTSTTHVAKATIEDFMPEYGSWAYVVPTAVVPVIQAPHAVPAKPVAGQRFTVSFPVGRSDNGRPLTSGRMDSAVFVSGKLIAHTESFGKGLARVSFVVPESATGTLLEVKATIDAGSRSASRIATFRVSSE